MPHANGLPSTKSSAGKGAASFSPPGCGAFYNRNTRIADQKTPKGCNKKKSAKSTEKRRTWKTRHESRGFGPKGQGSNVFRTQKNEGADATHGLPFLMSSTMVGLREYGLRLTLSSRKSTTPNQSYSVGKSPWRIWLPVQQDLSDFTWQAPCLNAVKRFTALII